MPEESEFVIAHVLCTDIVGYSKLTIDDQSNQLQKLNEVVRGTDAFQRADAAGKLLRIPTGDGMVLVFFTHPQDPAECAAQVAEKLLAYSDVKLRMGVHSGPVNRVSDVNERSNVAGAGINFAQRVMDAGDAGHILFSKRVAEDLAHYNKWRPYLHELGEVEVKHGVKIEIYNFVTDHLGNSARPSKVKRASIAKKRRIAAPIILGFLVLAVLLGLGGLWFASQRAKSSNATATAPEKSVAILPFRPLSSQNRDESLENGMADTLIAKLSRLTQIVIPSLSSAQKYLEQEHDPVAAAKLLHVRTVLEGTLQRAADRIRVSARLINVADGASMWSDTFDEKFTDVFGVEDTIAQKVADALRVRLSGEQQKQLTKRYTENTDAYQLYLRGRFEWNKATAEGYQKGIEFLKQAIGKDANYALAYAGIADCYSLLGELGIAPPKEMFPQAREFAEKALKIDNELSEAHLSLGIVLLFYDWNRPAAKIELERARELNPSDPQVHHFYGHYLEFMGRFDDAEKEIKRGVDLDPTNMIVNAEYGWTFYLRHRYDEAIALYRDLLKLDPSFILASVWLAQAYEEKGMYAEAMAELERARKIDNWAWIVAEIGCVQAHLGKPDEANKIIEELKVRSAHEYIDETLLVYIYTALGEKDQAFAWMEKGLQSRAGNLPWLGMEPKLDPLRSDPRFAPFVKRVFAAESR